MEALRPSGLTAKEESFIKWHVRYRYSQWRAARAAGYKGDRVQLEKVGSEIANRPRVLAAMAAALAEGDESGAMSKEEILYRLSEYARSAQADYLRPDGTYNLQQMINDGKGWLIKSIRETKYGKVIEFHDAQKAKELLGKYWKLWTERLEVDPNSEITVRVVYENKEENPYDQDTGDNEQCVAREPL